MLVAKGSENVVPDTFSRIHCDSLQIFRAETTKIISSIDLNSSYFSDEEYVSLRNEIINNPQCLPTFKIHNDRIYIRLDLKPNNIISDQSMWKLWIPSTLRKYLKTKHDDPIPSHSGVSKTLERFYFFFA